MQPRRFFSSSESCISLQIIFLFIISYFSQGEPIGFIGLGNMGGPMAKNLLNAGHEILVHDIFSEAVVDLKQLGAATATTPSEVASKATTIVTMLPSR